MPSKVSNEITNPFSNLNGSIVEIVEWMYNFFAHFKPDVIAYTC